MYLVVRGKGLCWSPASPDDDVVFARAPSAPVIARSWLEGRVKLSFRKVDIGNNDGGGEVESSGCDLAKQDYEYLGFSVSI